MPRFWANPPVCVATLSILRIVRRLVTTPFAGTRWRGSTMVISQPAIVCLQRATDDLVARGARVGHSACGFLRRGSKSGAESAPSSVPIVGARPLGLPFPDPTRALDARLERERLRAGGSA
jgi:hypothetical protein